MNESEHEHEPGHTSGTAERAARDLHPPIQLIHLGEMVAELQAERERRNLDHSAYTLRNGIALRQVLIAFRAGGEMADHHADGGVAIQVLSGEVAVTVQGAQHALGAGDLLDLEPGLIHSVSARRESAILLTVSPVGSLDHPDAGAS
jgi:quercetin dioxygenase-like cupin family protein